MFDRLYSCDFEETAIVYLESIMHDFKTVVDIYRKIGFILTQEQKRGAGTSFLAMIVCSLMELLGVSVIYPFLQLIIDEDTFRTKWYVNILYSINSNISHGSIIVIFCLVLIFVFLSKNVMALLCTYVQNKYAEKLRRELATEVFESFMKRPYEFFVNTNSGTIVRDVQTGPRVVNEIIVSIFQFITEFMTVALIGLYLLYMDWMIALATLLIGALCFLVIVLGFKKRIKVMGKEEWEIGAKTFQICSQAVGGIKEIIVKDRRESFVKQYESAAVKAEKINLVYRFLIACPDRVLEAVCMSGFLGIVSLRICMGIDINSFVSTLGVFAMGAFKILPSISKMSSRVNSIVFEIPGLNSCYDNIKSVRKYEEAMESGREENGLKSDSDVLPHELKSNIRIKDVVWKYAHASRVVLNKLNLTIAKGESVGLIGESGAGKTTLADIILGLYKPREGDVLMDGKDIHSISHQWSKLIAYVPQTVYLLDDTVRANIAFGIPDEEISEDRIWETLRQAKLDEFVRSLPNGLDTYVGERGVKFSGGQRQRVAIARALYDEPSILVLDEATSALDNETENAVMEAIDSLRGNKTLIIVAHRLSTIRNCDRIFEIRDGVAVEKNPLEVLSVTDN